MRQSELDLEMLEAGKHRYYRGVRGAVEGGRESGTDYGSRLVSGGLELVIRRLHKDRANKRAASCTAGLVILIENDVKLEVAALISGQVIIDCISKIQRASACAGTIGRLVENEVLLRMLRKEDYPQFRRILAWREELSPHRKRVGIVKVAKEAGRNMPPESGLGKFSKMVHEFPAWSAEKRHIVGSYLMRCWIEETGVVEAQSVHVRKNRTATVLAATPETRKYIDESMARGETLRLPKMPMVIPPRSWSTPFDGGYDEGLGDPLIRTRSAPALESATKEAMPLVYSVVNSVQKVPFRVNRRVLEILQSLWESRSRVDGIPVEVHFPVPEKPADLENKPAILAWRRANAESLRLHREQDSRRIGFLMSLRLAQKFGKDDAWFFHPASLDFRGRLFTQASSLTHQGTDVQKGLVEFGNGHRIERGSAAMGYWLVHGANVRGLKGSFRSRADAMGKTISSGEAEAVAKDPLGRLDLWAKADEPFQYLAWCMDVAGVRKGEPSHLMVAQDGSCNGLQVLSLLLRDEIGGAAVNLLPSSETDTPADIYALVAARVAERIASDAASGNEWAQGWLKFNVGRSDVKRQVMVVPYNGTFQAMLVYTREAYIDKGIDCGFPLLGKPVAYLARLIVREIAEVAVKAMEFTAWVRKASKILTAGDVHPWWTTPSGFIVHHRYMSFTGSRVSTAIGQKQYRWHTRQETAKIDGRKQANALMPNLVHSLDAAAEFNTADLMLRSGIEDMAFVHDSYLVHAANAPKCASLLRQGWADTFAGDPLASWVRQIAAQVPSGKELPPLPAYGSLDPRDLLQSRYFFC